MLIISVKVVRQTAPVIHPTQSMELQWMLLMVLVCSHQFSQSRGGCTWQPGCFSFNQRRSETMKFRCVCILKFMPGTSRLLVFKDSPMRSRQYKIPSPFLMDHSNQVSIGSSLQRCMWWSWLSDRTGSWDCFLFYILFWTCIWHPW
jgi:hypothetical protein